VSGDRTGGDAILEVLIDDTRDGQAVVPRAIGRGTLSAKRRGDASVIDGLRTSGCLKLLFPPKPDRCESILINTAGGLTGGDRLDLSVTAGPGAHLAITTQAAERAYRAQSGRARVSSDLAVGAGGTMFWLPQELILFEGAALERRLTCDLAPDARLLLVEPVVFGRALMGETLRDVAFRDRIEIRRGGRPLYRDQIRFDGDVARHLARPAIADGAGAIASLIFVAPDAEALLPAVRALLPATGGASLLHPDVLVLRLLAEDSFALRQSLLPVLDLISQDRLPASWRL